MQTKSLEAPLITKSYQKPTDVWSIPESFEDFFRTFDDTIMSWIQWCDPNKGNYQTCGKISLFFAQLISEFTAIEYGVVAALTLYILTFDALANITVLSTFTLALISQFPKRFLFRSRPYMVNRAEKHADDYTSSFPSRGVSGGVLFSYLALSGVNYYNHQIDTGVFAWNFPVIEFYQIILIMLFVTLYTSWGRMYLGMHYASDCIIGAIQGVLSIFVAQGLSYIPLFDCSDCFERNCYGTLSSPSQINYIKPVICLIVCLVFALLVTLPAINFWRKSSFVFGLTVSMLIFRVTLLCPFTDAGYALGYRNEITYIMLGIAAVTFIAFIVLARKMVKIKSLSSGEMGPSILAFVLVLGGSGVWLFSYRLILDTY